MKEKSISADYSQKKTYTTRITINDQLCMRCGCCVRVCPHDILVQMDENAFPETFCDDECISCAHCVAICTNGAITHKDHYNNIKLIDKSVFPTIEQVMCLLKSKRSIRGFRDKKVEKHLIEIIIDGARSAASSSNSNNIEYVIVQDKPTLDGLVKIIAEFYGKLVYLLKNPEILDKLPESSKNRLIASKPLLPTFERISNRIKSGNDILQNGTPTLLIAHAADDPFDWPLVNASIALQNTSLVCSALMLGSCQLGYIESIADRNHHIHELLDIPYDHAIYGVIAFGYPKYTFDNLIEKEKPITTWK